MLDSNKLLYINRSTEQELFIEALNQGNYLDINGIYGQGKTAFLKWIHDNQTNYCCIYIDLTASNTEIHNVIANYPYDEILYPDNPFSEFKLKSQNSVIDFDSFNKGLNYILTFQKIVLCIDNTDAITAKNWQTFEENISKHYSDNPNLILITTSQVATQFNNQLKQRLKCVFLSNFTKTQIQENLEAISKEQDFVIENQDEIADELLKATNGHPFSINFLIRLWSDNFQNDLNIIKVREQFTSSISELIKVLIEEKILSQLELEVDVNKAKLFLQTIAPLRYILPRTQHHLLVHFLPEYEAQQPFLAVRLSSEFQKINLLIWESSVGYKLNLTIRHLLLTEMLLTSKQKFLVIQNSLVELYDNMTHESQGDSKITRFIEKLYHYAIFLTEKESDEINKLVGKEIQNYLNQYFESDSSLLTEIDITVLNQLKQALTNDTQLAKLVDVEFLIKNIDNFIQGEIEEEEEEEEKEEVTSTPQPQPEVLIDNNAVLSRPVTGDTVWINLLTNRLLSIDHEYDQTEFLLENGTDIKGNYRLNARLEEELGENDAGVVWKATDLLQEAAGSRDKLVAIKFLSQAFFKQHPETLKKLAFEFNRYKRLHHPNLAAADEINHIGNYIFIVMGFLQGIPLTQFIKNNPQGIPLNDAKPIIQGIGNALAYMHDKGIMRVDLKPSNIDYDPVRKFAKLIDFAIARTIIPIKRINTQTESYISLENLSDIDPSPADDIYAFACITYELLSGKHPFDRKTALKAQRDQLIPEPIDKLSVEQNQTLLKALVFDKEHRIATIDQFLAGLFPPPPKPPMWVNLFTSALLSEDEQDTIIEEGTVIRDNYRLLQVIDEDGFGTVWQAIDLTVDNNRKNERYVTIKFVNQALFKQDVDILKNLVYQYSQGSRCKKIHNAHIVTADELDRFGNKIFTVMEFLAATSLKDLLKEYPKGLDFKKVKDIITSLAQTITALHEKGLNCLKLAPANIFYDPDRKITQIIQFDITRPFKEDQIKAYQSIESLSNLDSSPQDDIYALACITYELLTGEHPFAGKTALTASEENLSPKPIPQLEATASQTLLRSLSFKKEDRTIKIDEFINNIFTKQNKYFLILITNIVLVAAVAMAILWFNSVEDVKTPEPEPKPKPIPSEPKIPQVETPKTEIPEPEIPSEPQIDLNILLEECNNLYNLQYYTKNDSGGDRTALLCYREVMEREPNNIEAKTQLEKMENYYITRVKSNIHFNRLKAAEKWLLSLKQVNPNSPHIAQLESALKRKEQ